MNEPLVSYIVPFYNACSGGRQQAWFEQCIESMLSQTYDAIEIILVDDGSSDHSRAVAEKYGGDRRICIVEGSQNEGIAVALNRGLSLSHGEFVARLDSDDAALPDRTAKQAAYLMSRPEIHILGGGMRVIDTVAGTETDVPPKALGWESVYGVAQKECPFFHPTVMMRRSVYIERGGYSTCAYKHAEDYAYWVRLLQKTRSTKCKRCKGENMPDVVSIVRRHRNRISAKHYKEQCAAARLISARANF